MWVQVSAALENAWKDGKREFRVKLNPLGQVRWHPCEMQVDKERYVDFTDPSAFWQRRIDSYEKRRAVRREANFGT